MPKRKKIARILVVAGSDSGGGAGLQGDIKAISALGGYASTAVTALTAQNTKGVFGIHDVPEEFVAQQMKLVLSDIGADAIKTGMLHKARVIKAVAKVLKAYPKIPLILDPVMVAKGGAALLAPGAVKALKKKLIPRALLITPNIPEAEMLLKSMNRESRIASRADMESAARVLLGLGCRAVLIKGGHLKGSTAVDVLVSKQRDSRLATRIFISPRIATRHTHGTGCALASAIATFVAQGMALEKAVRRARDYVHQAIKNAPGLGKGHGPLGH